MFEMDRRRIQKNELEPLKKEKKRNQNQTLNKLFR